MLKGHNHSLAMALAHTHQYQILATYSLSDSIAAGEAYHSFQPRAHLFKALRFQRRLGRPNASGQCPISHIYAQYTKQGQACCIIILLQAHEKSCSLCREARVAPL